MAAGFVEGGDGFVNLVALHARAGFQSVCCVESGAGSLLGLGEFAEEDVAISQCLFHDEGVARGVAQRVGEGRGFCGTLCSVVVAGRLNDFADLAVCVAETRVGFLDGKASDFGAKVGFRNAKSCK